MTTMPLYSFVQIFLFAQHFNFSRLKCKLDFLIKTFITGCMAGQMILLMALFFG